MSEPGAAVPSSGAASTASPEKDASSPNSAKTGPPTSTAAPKLRSCVVCRNRKVRCDKQTPCSNCRAANISCVYPTAERAPRWARRFERRLNNQAAASNSLPPHAEQGPGKVMDRLRTLESLVKELRGQLEQASTAATAAGGVSSGVNTSGSSPRDGDTDASSPGSIRASSVEKQFGRLVLQDAGRGQYVSSGFWSRVNDEVCRSAWR
jgi:hypothetical protein